MHIRSGYHDLRVHPFGHGMADVRDHASDADTVGSLIRRFGPPLGWIRAWIWTLLHA